MSDPHLYLELFQGFRARVDNGAPLEVARQQAGALLAYLALHRESVLSREELSVLFWPEAEQEEGRQNLRRYLYLLRNQWEQPPFEKGSLLLTTRFTVQLNPLRVQTDVAAFEEAVRAAETSSDPAERIRLLSQAVDLYRGELLHGFYQDGFISERLRLDGVYRNALHALTLTYEQAGDLNHAIETALRAVATDPLMEEAHCDLMRLYAAQGQPSAVLRQYQELERVLQEELGETPSEEVRHLMESLRHRAQVRSTEPSNGHAPPAPSATVPPPSRTQALISDSVPLASVSPAPRMRLPQRLPVTVICVLSLALLWLLTHRQPGITSRPSASASVPSAAPKEARPLWVARYPPLPDEIDSSEPTALITDGAGNIYVTGFTRTEQHDVDYLTLKYDPNGNLLWRARYNGPGNDVDRARSIALDHEGNVYVTGDSDNGKGNGQTRLSGLDIATIKYDGQTGKELWVQRYNGPADGEEWAKKIVVNPTNGGICVVGISRTGQRSSDEGPCREGILIKYDRVGRVQWVRREGVSELAGHVDFFDLAGDMSGNLYIVGSTTTVKHLVRNEDFLIVKYTPGGEIEWKRTYGAPSNGIEVAQHVSLDSTGIVYVTGIGFIGVPTNGGGHRDVLTIQYDPAGNERWKQTYDFDKKNEFPNGIAVTPGGDIGVCGETKDGDYFIMRSTPSGTVQWAQTYNGLGNFQDNATAIAFDSQGYLLVTGYAWNRHREGQNGTAWDFVTLKYAPNGQALWIGRYDHSRWEDKAYVLAVDRQDNVIVAGQSGGGEKSNFITLVKYAP